MTSPRDAVAARVDRAAEDAAQPDSFARQVADRLAAGILVVSRTRTVLMANHAARALAVRRNGIRIDEQHVVRGETPQTEERLERLVEFATGPSARPGGSFVVRHGEHRLVVHVLPLTPDSRSTNAAAGATSASEPTAMIVVAPLDAYPGAPDDVLRSEFGLSRAEARIATLVAEGHGLAHVAELLTVTLSTVRVHLQRVYEKTGLHRQAELGALVTALAAGLRWPDGRIGGIPSQPRLPAQD